MPYWYDRQGKPISIEQAEVLLGDMDARRVALTEVGGGVVVSTVHLVLDHGFPFIDSLDDVRKPRPPLIFETAVFRNGLDDTRDVDIYGRAPTEAAALAMHDQAIAHEREVAGHG